MLQPKPNAPLFPSLDLGDQTALFSWLGPDRKSRGIPFQVSEEFHVFLGWFADLSSRQCDAEHSASTPRKGNQTIFYDQPNEMGPSGKFFRTNAWWSERQSGTKVAASLGTRILSLEIGRAQLHQTNATPGSTVDCSVEPSCWQTIDSQRGRRPLPTTFGDAS
jgi:hypothetical protein